MFKELRQEFPIFQAYPQLVYLDNAATTHKPQAVLDAERHFYTKLNANPYRGVYSLAAQTTLAYDLAREQVANFLGVVNPSRLIFTRGATESANLVASSFGPLVVKEADTILVSALEHHSNLLPWQRLANQQKANLSVIPIDEEGSLDLAAFKQLLSLKPKIIALTHLSNVIGRPTPLKEIKALCREVEAQNQQPIYLVIDGAQAIAHLPVNLAELDPDFYFFSGHKIYAPQGIGLLYAKMELLNKMPPYQLGGGMVQQATYFDSSFSAPPQRFEAGTPNVAGAIGLAAALNWFSQFSQTERLAHEAKLASMLIDGLKNNPRVKLVGSPTKDCALASWNLENMHPHDAATLLAEQEIALRAGHHCAMPLMRHFNLSASLRASLAIYNNENDIERLLTALTKLPVW